MHKAPRPPCLLQVGLPCWNQERGTSRAWQARPFGATGSRHRAHICGQRGNLTKTSLMLSLGVPSVYGGGRMEVSTVSSAYTCKESKPGRNTQDLRPCRVRGGAQGRGGRAAAARQGGGGTETNQHVAMGGGGGGARTTLDNARGVSMHPTPNPNLFHLLQRLAFQGAKGPCVQEPELWVEPDAGHPETFAKKLP